MAGKTLLEPQCVRMSTRKVFDWMFSALQNLNINTEAVAYPGGADGIMTAHGVHALIPETCEYVTLHGRRDFKAEAGLRILGWGHYPGLPCRS